MDGYNKDIFEETQHNILIPSLHGISRQNATDFSGKLLKASKYEEIARHRIFSRKLLREQYNIPEEVSEEDYPIKGITGLGNITLINTSVNSEIYSENPETT